MTYKTFRCDDGEGNENVKTKNMFDKKNNNFTRATTGGPDVVCVTE